jgi:plastocyanin
MSRVNSVVTVGAFALLLLSGIATAIPAASAITTVQVSMPAGAGNGPNSAPGFTPDTITVVIGVNNTVEWTNNDSPSHHNVASAAGNGTIQSPDMAPGATFTYTFSTPGTYNIVCTYHQWMTSVVIVKSSTAPAPEFPAAWLAVILFAVIAVAVVAAPRLKPSLATIRPN